MIQLFIRIIQLTGFFVGAVMYDSSAAADPVRQPLYDTANAQANE